MIANVVSSAVTSSAAFRGCDRSSSHPSLVGSGHGVDSNRLARDGAQPIDAGACDVSHDRPDRPMVGRCPDRELLVRQRRDGVDEAAVVLRPAVIEGADRHGYIVAGRGSRTTIAVSRDRSAALASVNAELRGRRNLAHSRARSSPVAARAVTSRDPSGQLDRRLRIRLEVEPPGGLRVGPAVHRRGDEVGTVLDVADDRDALLAGPAPDRLEPEHPPLRVGRRAQAEPAAR